MNFTKEELDSMPVPAGKVVFLGSNPSCSSPYHDPFSHCKSANKILNEWIPALGLTRDQVHFMNVANYKTPGNRPLKGNEIRQEILRLFTLTEGQVIITLGTAAEKAIEFVQKHHDALAGRTRAQRPFVISMPHPSGRNRLLNDKAWVAKTLAEAKEKIQEALKQRGNKG